MANPPAASQAYISLRSYLGATGPSQQSACNYTSPNSLIAEIANVTTVVIAPSAVNQAINLASLFPTAYPIFVTLQDTGSPGTGFKWTTVSGSGKQVCPAGGLVAYSWDGSTAPATIYVDNPDTVNKLYLQVGILANATPGG